MTKRVRLIKKIEATARSKPNDGVQPKRYSRRRAAALLSTSVMTLIRLEERGVLEGLRDFKNGNVFYRARDIDRLCGE